MIIRGKWRLTLQLLLKQRAKVSRKEYATMWVQLIAMLPWVAIYSALYSIAEALEWIEDKLMDAGYWVHERAWRD